MRSLLIRLYPARWRARYGDEFALILEERPLGPFDVADILLGALDAQLRLRGQDAQIKKGMGFSMSLRLGGAAAIVGAVLFPVGLTFSSLTGAESPFPGAVLLLAATGALLVALIGLSSFQARTHPRLVWAAFALPALGTVVSSLGLVAMATLGDRPFVPGLSPWSIWMLGVMATVVGSILFALATYRTRTLPRSGAGLLAVGSTILLIVVVVGTGGIWAESVERNLTLAALIGFSIGWIAMGWTSMRLGQPAAAAA